MPEIQLQTILNNGEVPTLNPVANFAALNSLTTTNLLIGATCITVDTKEVYIWNGVGIGWTLVPGGGGGGNLTWQPMIPGTGWTTTAEVAKIPGTNAVLMRGYFTSIFENNVNNIATFPIGFEPINFGFRQVLMKQPPAQEFITSGIVDWAGSGQTLIVNPVLRVDSGDLVISTIRQPGSQNIYSVSAEVVMPITIEFRLPVANIANDVSISYLVIRNSDYKNAEIQFNGGGLAFKSSQGTTAMEANIEDVVYFDGIVYSTTSS